MPSLKASWVRRISPGLSSTRRILIISISAIGSPIRCFQRQTGAERKLADNKPNRSQQLLQGSANGSPTSTTAVGIRRDQTQAPGFRTKQGSKLKPITHDISALDPAGGSKVRSK